MTAEQIDAHRQSPLEAFHIREDHRVSRRIFHPRCEERGGGETTTVEKTRPTGDGERARRRRRQRRAQAIRGNVVAVEGRIHQREPQEKEARHGDQSR